MTDPAQPSPPPAPTPPGGNDTAGREVARRRAAIGLLVIVLVALVGGVLTLVSRAPAAPPSPSPTGVAAGTASPHGTGPASAPGTSPSASPPSSPATTPPAPAPTVSPPPELAAQIREVESQVPPIRGLEPRQPVQVRLLERSAAARELRAIFERDTPPAEFAAQEGLLKRLGLVPAELDLKALVLELLTVQVLGFYDPKTGQMTVLSRTGKLGPLERVVLAHEYTHALQDQHFDLEELQRDEATEGDRALARRALVEGDATLLMSRWSARHLTPDEAGQLLDTTNDAEQRRVLERTPEFLRRQLSFPYAEGAIFVAQLFTRDGWKAVDRAFRDPPESTEQILHAEKYFDRERPVRVELPAAEAALGSGWRRTVIDTFGELNVSLWLDVALGVGRANRAAAGWAGDRMASYENPGGGWAIAWETAWDSPQEAEEFRAAAVETVGKLAGRGEVTAVGQDRVRILLANDEPTLAALRGAFSP